MMGLTNNTQGVYTRPEQTTLNDENALIAGVPSKLSADQSAAIPKPQQSLNNLKFQSRGRKDDYSDSSYSSSDVHVEAINPVTGVKSAPAAPKKVASEEEKKRKHELEVEVEMYTTRLHEVLARKKQRRCRVIALDFVFMIMFSLYFVGSYFMSYKTYSIVP